MSRRQQFPIGRQLQGEVRDRFRIFFSDSTSGGGTTFNIPAVNINLSTLDVLKGKAVVVLNYLSVLTFYDLTATPGQFQQVPAIVFFNGPNTYSNNQPARGGATFLATSSMRFMSNTAYENVGCYLGTAPFPVMTISGTIQGGTGLAAAGINANSASILLGFDIMNP